ncbi:MAG: hypothetical protein HQ592_04045 [Planctomycetes bacterium]|nr:hypothetical protein [Planctomycetota bacterium]
MKATHKSGFCDLHCHILPQIDDGPHSLEQSVQMCRLAAADGITTIVATPHFNSVYHPAPDRVQRAADDLRQALAAEELPLEIVLGADVAAGADLGDLTTTKQYLTIGGQGKYILFEPPARTMPEWITDIIFGLRLAGLSVIITHPERNARVQQEPNIIIPMVQSGVMVQITADSITGNFGREAKKCASALLKMNAVHFIASDAHSPRDRAPRLSCAAHKASKYLGESAFELVCDNPRAVVEGGIVEIPDPEPIASWFRGIALSN